ncbi:MAG: SGNH/GDSL hydrolase family protein [Holophagales bacterium]|nr:SGNH/GDSL hydrolase family protein [Holophagales bacterium]
MESITSSRAKNLALVVGGSIVGALLGIGIYEIVENVRYYQWRNSFGGTAWLGSVTVPSEDPELMWEYRPHAQHKRIRTNQHGFRGADVPIEKPSGVIRVAFVGDSVTLGYGEELENIFVEVFVREAALLDLARSVEGLNFGIDGYATPQIARMVESRVLPFEPDHVVYVMCLNDFDFTTSAGEKVLYFRKPRSFFLGKMEHLLRKLRGHDFHTHKFLKNRGETYEHILRMRDGTEGVGARFQLVLLPIFPRPVHSFAAYPHQDIHDHVRAFAAENGIAFLDLLDEMRARGGPPRAYANDVWHPNPDGHRVIGETLLRVLEGDRRGASGKVDLPLSDSPSPAPGEGAGG